jgi:periplasmic protein TonB
MTVRRAVLPLVLLLPLLGGCRREPEVVTEPRQQNESRFQYPEELWDAGVQGRVTLRLFIAAGGTVDTVRVEQSSGHEAFDSAALSGARRLRFEPARRGGQPFAVWRTLPVEFNLGPARDSAGARTQTDSAP